MSMNTPPVQRVRSNRSCDVFGCTAGEHGYWDNEKDDLCCALAIGEGDYNQTWHVAAYRDEDTGLWSAFCEDPEIPDQLEGGEGLIYLEKLTLAFRAVQQHCDQLNAHGRSTS